MLYRCVPRLPAIMLVVVPLSSPGAHPLFLLFAVPLLLLPPPLILLPAGEMGVDGSDASESALCMLAVDVGIVDDDDDPAASDDDMAAVEYGL